MEPDNQRRSRRLSLVQTVALVASLVIVLAGMLYAAWNITHPTYITTTTVQQQPTTTSVLKSLGYVEVAPSPDDVLVWYVAQHFSNHMPVALGVFAHCGYMDPDVCNEGYPAFSTSRYPVVFVADDHILAMLGEVHYTGDASRIALVSDVPTDWQDLTQLDNNQLQQMLQAMPTIAHATSPDTSEDTVTVPPFNTGVRTVWLDLSSMSHPVA